MKNSLFIAAIFVFLIGTGSCVSKKKYLRLEDEKSNSAKVYEQLLVKSGKRSDSLSFLLAQKDSIIDSLNIKLADLQKKEKNKGSIPLAAKKSSLTKEQEYSKKALFIYNFTKYIEWPVEYNGTNFVIGVAGDEGILKQLQSLMEDKKTFGKKIIIKEYVKGAKYQIVFITAPKAGSAASIKNDVRKKKTVLIMDEDPGQHSHISFLIDDDKIRYIVNKISIEKLGLKVAQELMRYSG